MGPLFIVLIVLTTIMTTEATYLIQVSLTSVRQLNFTDMINVRSILDCASICSQSVDCAILTNDNDDYCYFINSSTTERIGAREVSSLHINTQLIEKCTNRAYINFLADGFCWKEYNTNSDWSTASTTCEQDGGRLILMRKWEIDVKKLRLDDMNLTATSYFVGGSDLDEEGRWVWNDGSPMSMTDSWKPDQPDNWNNNEDCLELRYPNPRFFDARCLATKPFICEIELF